SHLDQTKTDQCPRLAHLAPPDRRVLHHDLLATSTSPGAKVLAPPALVQAACQHTRPVETFRPQIPRLACFIILHAKTSPTAPHYPTSEHKRNDSSCQEASKVFEIYR